MVRLLICAGGTGGGVYPALVVLQALGKDADPVLWVGGEGGMEADLVKRAGVPYASIPAAGVHGVGALALPGNVLRLVRGSLAALKIVREFKPDVLLFTGGYVAAPMAVAGRRIPSLLYVPDIEPGLALKFLARYSSRIALTADESKQYFPDSYDMTVTGYPTRPELSAWTRDAARAHMGLDGDRFTLLVTGGSKGAQTLNHPVMDILPQLLEQMQVVHITGQPDWELAQSTREKLAPRLASRYFIMPYLHEMGAALASADLAVSRAGASTLGEYPLCGLPSILVPYPYAWRYQKVNADFLAKHGAAMVIATDELRERLLPAIQKLAGEPESLEQMRAACRSLAKPGAAGQIADMVRELKTGRATGSAN